MRAGAGVRNTRKNNTPPPDSIGRRPTAGGRVTMRPFDKKVRPSPAATGKKTPALFMFEGFS
jgi:hypothetical protein